MQPSQKWKHVCMSVVVIADIFIKLSCNLFFYQWLCDKERRLHYRHKYLFSMVTHHGDICIPCSSWFFFSFFAVDESKGLLDTLGALFVKLDHAACRQSITAWESLAVTLQQFCTTHGKGNLSVVWDERADWWPQFHFRPDLVPNKDHVTELEWKLTRHKAEAARWLLGKSAVWIFLA